MGELFACICSEVTLFDAWQRVERKGSQGGIDRITVAAFGQRRRRRPWKRQIPSCNSGCTSS